VGWIDISKLYQYRVKTIIKHFIYMVGVFTIGIMYTYLSISFNNTYSILSKIP